MPNLCLGVIDVSYSDDGPKAPRKRKHNKTGRSKGAEAPDTGPATTVQVATALEDKYHVMQVWYDQNQDDVANALIHGMEGALEDLYAGAPVRDPFAEVNDEISQGFRQWLLQGEIEHLGVEGVPTQAAIERRSLRFKKGVGPSERPSFVDTATYELAFRGWVE